MGRNLLNRIVTRLLVSSSSRKTIERRRDRLAEMVVLLDDKARQLSDDAGLPVLASFDGRSRLQISICDKRAPWVNANLAEFGIPGMVSEEERRYYEYLSRFYSGAGAIVEIGPWLGQSTAAIVNGLIANPSFRGRTLRVFDDFVWRSSWMDKWLSDQGTDVRKPENHGDFQPLFAQFTDQFAGHIDAQKRRVAPYDGNNDVPDLSWNDGPIELLFVDCGRTFEVNEGWYRVLAPSFIPDRTLVVLQDWRTHRQTPRVWYNQIKDFSDSKAGELQLVHELRDGGVGTFLYRGRGRA